MNQRNATLKILKKRTFPKDGQRSKNSCKRWRITENIFPNSLKNMLVENLEYKKKRCKITSLEIDAETTEAVVILIFFFFLVLSFSKNIN